MTPDRSDERFSSPSPSSSQPDPAVSPAPEPKSISAPTPDSLADDAAFYFSKDRMRDALTLASRAADLALKDGLVDTYARASMCAADSWVGLGDAHAARCILEAAVVRSVKFLDGNVSDPKPLAALYAQLGDEYGRSSEHGKAESLYENALLYFGAGTDGRARLLRGLGEAQLLQGKLAEASETYAEATASIAAGGGELIEDEIFIELGRGITLYMTGYEDGLSSITSAMNKASAVSNPGILQSRCRGFTAQVLEGFGGMRAAEETSSIFENILFTVAE